MSSSQTNPGSGTGTPRAGAVDMKLEVVAVPVSDVDRAKAFYSNLGWRVDADFAKGDHWRAIQVTPTGSTCSFFIGKGITNATPGSLQELLLTVDNVDAARTDLIGRGVEVSDVFHFEDDVLHFTGTHGRLPGPDPQRRSYLSWASFSDPDGNEWMLQEITARLPGRGLGHDVATQTALLRETSERHGPYELSAPKHHWSDWYGAYMVARERGRSPDEAAADAGRHMEAVFAASR
jgi:catechol 2,3-dioxygenase-like lactoylglutathione lyase family enzyme